MEENLENKILENEIENVMPFDDVPDIDVDDSELEDIPDYDGDLAIKIVEDCCGKDDSGTPKAGISIASEMWSFQGDKSRTVATQSTNKPEVNILKRVEFIQIDLKFPSHIDSDMKVMWNTLEKYGLALNNLDAKSIEVPFLSLTVVPISYNGTYYIVCTNPIFWALQPEKPGERSNIIRLFFKSEDMGFYESDEIDAQEIEAGAQRIIQEREMMTQNIERKQEEEQAYIDERNARIEEMRRKGQL